MVATTMTEAAVSKASMSEATVVTEPAVTEAVMAEPTTETDAAESERPAVATVAVAAVVAAPVIGRLPTAVVVARVSRLKILRSVLTGVARPVHAMMPAMCVMAMRTMMTSACPDIGRLALR